VTRAEATHVVVRTLPEDAIVANLGHTAYDLFSAGDRDANFYTWGSMGLASSIGLGLALARPDLRVVVLDGDGSLLMNLGSLATIAANAPQNLTLVVWDNAQHATTGGQPTATAGRANLAATARALGVSHVATADAIGSLTEALDSARTSPGPHVIVARVVESPPTAKPPLDCVFIKHRFMRAIGSRESATCAVPIA
jgi:phosphonopyruvate decarboxylase